MASDDVTDDLTGLIYDAVLDPSAWGGTLARLRDVARSKAVLYLIIDEAASSIAFQNIIEFDESAIRGYVEHYWQDARRKAGANQPAGATLVVRRDPGMPALNSTSHFQKPRDAAHRRLQGSRGHRLGDQSPEWLP